MSKQANPSIALNRRIAFVSITGFWAVYYVVWSLRALLIYNGPLSTLLPRACVALISMAIAFALYIALRAASKRGLMHSIVVAIILSIPAAALHATSSWAVFRMWQTSARTWLHDVPNDRQPQVMKLYGPAPKSGTASVRAGKSADRDAPAPAGMQGPIPQTLLAQGGFVVRVPGENAVFSGIVDQAISGYFFFIAWATLYLALCYAVEVRALERRAAELRAAAQSSELRALRYQVNPHFLFNTLNSISSLVMTGRRDAAEKMILNLSTFFRSSLAGDPTADVKLSQEIRLQELYLEIEAVRFPDRLMVRIDVSEGLEDARVPGLILQPLVENSIKHGMSQSLAPITIDIRAREDGGTLSIVVHDDGASTTPVMGSAGIGLCNVQDRLQARFGDAASCHWTRVATGGFTVEVRMPLVYDER